MPYSVEVIADSIAPTEHRLTTLAVSLPRIVLAELNTHRMFSRNSASSRAIPIQRVIDKVMSDPFVPFYWGANQKGMQAHVEIDDSSRATAQRTWLLARDKAVEQAIELVHLGVHKQLANRLLEPWLYTTVLVSATEWENFFALRCHPDAQPELRRAAELMRDALVASTPRKLEYGEWHMPYSRSDDTAQYNDEPTWAPQLLCVARCARVSYDAAWTLQSRRNDLDLATRLQQSGHWSPFEHVAQVAMNNHGDRLPGNFRGWLQLRHLLSC